MLKLGIYCSIGFIVGKVETKKELELSKKIHDQKQIIESFGKQLLAFAAMEIEAESA